jgi:hypothetical protein
VSEHGRRPPDWTPEDERELQRLVRNRRTMISLDMLRRPNLFRRWGIYATSPGTGMEVSRLVFLRPGKRFREPLRRRASARIGRGLASHPEPVRAQHGAHLPDKVPCSSAAA